MRAIVLTRSLRRHAYVANTLALRLEVARVWRERKVFEPLKYATTEEGAAVRSRTMLIATPIGFPTD